MLPLPLPLPFLLFSPFCCIYPFYTVCDTSAGKNIKGGEQQQSFPVHLKDN